MIQFRVLPRSSGCCPDKEELMPLLTAFGQIFALLHFKKMLARNLFLAVILMPFALSAQTKEEMTELKQKRNAFLVEISQLQDSVQIIERKLDRLKSAQQEQKEDSLEVLPEIPRWKVKQVSSLMSRPHPQANVIARIEEGTKVQRIDQIGTFYLVCIKGKCGYLNSSAFAPAKEDKKPQMKGAVE